MNVYIGTVCFHSCLKTDRQKCKHDEMNKFQQVLCSFLIFILNMSF